MRWRRAEGKASGTEGEASLDELARAPALLTHSKERRAEVEHAHPLRHGRLNRSAEFDMALESVDSPVNDHNVDHTRS